MMNPILDILSFGTLPNPIAGASGKAASGGLGGAFAAPGVTDAGRVPFGGPGIGIAQSGSSSFAKVLANFSDEDAGICAGSALLTDLPDGLAELVGGEGASNQLIEQLENLGVQPVRLTDHFGSGRGMSHEQLADLVDRLPEESLKSIYAMLFGHEWNAELAGTAVGNDNSTQPTEVGNKSAGELQIASSSDIKASLSAAGTQTTANLNSDQAIAVLSQDDSTPVVAARVELAAEASAKPAEATDLLSPAQPQKENDAAIAQAIKSQIYTLADESPRAMHKLVDHLSKLFPELKIASAELTATVSAEDTVETKDNPLQSRAALSRQTAEVEDFDALTRFQRTGTQESTPTVSRGEERKAQIIDLRALQNQNVQAEAMSNQKPEAGATASATPEAAALNQGATASATPKDFKSLEFSNRNEKQSDTHAIDPGSRNDSRVKLENPQPARAVSSTPDVENFRIVMRRAHIDALLQRGEVKMQLQPEHLGSLKIELHTHNSQMSARLETSSHEARQLVENNLPQLRESFEKLGIKLGEINVSVSDGRMSNQQGRFEQMHRGNLKRSVGIAQSEQVEVSPAASLSSAPLYAGGLNILA